MEKMEKLMKELGGGSAVPKLRDEGEERRTQCPG
jgi:hypothetical protein